MIKKVLLIFSLISLQAFAGDFETATHNNTYVFLYLYSPKCRYCTQFTPIYEKLANNNSMYAFVKVNANGIYGDSLMRKFKGRYVPFVVLYNSKNRNAAEIPPACYTDKICMERALNEFKTK